MNLTEIEKMIFNVLELANESREDFEKINITSDAKLYCKNGQIDSITLVALLADIEDTLADEGFNIILSDDQAMSLKHSPFESVSSLSAFISEKIINEVQS
jgi:acyl carrier protein